MALQYKLDGTLQQCALGWGFDIYLYTEFTITTDLPLLEGGGAVVEVWSPLRLEGLGCRLHLGQRLEVRSLGGNIWTKIMKKSKNILRNISIFSANEEYCSVPGGLPGPPE